MIDAALVLVIENSEGNLGVGETYFNEEQQRLLGSEPLEIEAVKCVSHFRKYAGKTLKDIPIYAICPTERPPSTQTINLLSQYDVVYIEKFFEETRRFACGYWNVPLACSWFESHCPFEYMIHIDLDMYCLRSFDELFKHFVDNKDLQASVGVMPPPERKAYNPFVHTFDFETNFIIAKTKSQFYSHWWRAIKEIEYRVDKGKIHVPVNFYADIEEYAVDFMYAEQGWRIRPIIHYQVGERYEAKYIPDDGLKHVYFHHNHQYESDKEYSEYMRRILSARNNSTKDASQLPF